LNPEPVKMTNINNTSTLNLLEHTGVVIVIPVYEDAESARLLFHALSKVVPDAWIVAVDDGSLVQPLNEEVLTSSGMQGSVIRLRRNLGHQGAIAVGLSYVKETLRECQCVVVMDSDGEDTVASVRQLLEGFAHSAADVRVAVRNKRSESFSFRLFYKLYKFLFRLLTGKTINFGNFMVLKPAALNRITAMNETWIHLASAIIASKLRIEGITIDRGIRYSGSSRMNFVSFVLHGFKAIMVFSESVLIRLGGASLFVAIIAIIAGLFAILLKTVDAASPGWTTTVLSSMVQILLQTGLLTLVTLMMTGTVRMSGLHQIDYKSFLDNIIEVRKQ